MSHFFLKYKHFLLSITFFFLINFIQTSTSYCSTDYLSDRVEYWKNLFSEENSRRSKKAQTVFKKILKASGGRSGVLPDLVILKMKKKLAMALQDDTVIISDKLLDHCYSNTKFGDERLAFVLGHEVAHLVEKDFSHYKFFVALNSDQFQIPEKEKLIEETKQILRQPGLMKKREFEADKNGMIFAALAGFDTRAFLQERETAKFIRSIEENLHPGNSFKISSRSHPSSEQRAANVYQALNSVQENLFLFNAGLIFYQKKDYEIAIDLFTRFLKIFHGREIYHNLALSHHQLAMEHYRNWKKDTKKIPFKFALSIDTVSRAGQIQLRDDTDHRRRYQHNLDLAINYYQEALRHDPIYWPAFNNLGCAFIESKDNDSALGMFKKALKIAPNIMSIHNNIGIALFNNGLIENAKTKFQSAMDDDSSKDCALFNLGKLAFEAGNMKAAEKHWGKYLKLDLSSPYSEIIRASFKTPAKKTNLSLPGKIPEINGVGFGKDEATVYRKWGEPIQWTETTLSSGIKIQSGIFKNGCHVIFKNSRIEMIEPIPGYSDRGPYGIKIGKEASRVLNKFGFPDHKILTVRGSYFIYPNKYLSVLVQDNLVISWIIL